MGPGGDGRGGDGTQKNIFTSKGNKNKNTAYEEHSRFVHSLLPEAHSVKLKGSRGAVVQG